MVGVVEVAHETPCPMCLRAARYTSHHQASPEIMERLAHPVSHEDAHEIVQQLETLHGERQVPVGCCQCGAPGSETTSAEFIDRAKREDLDYVASDVSDQLLRITLDGVVIWRSDLEQWRDGLDGSKANPISHAVESAVRMVELATWNQDLVEAFAWPAGINPPRAVYVRSKARLYCRIGPTKYRASDALRQPNISLSTESLNAIDQGMEQFSDGLGFNASTPLTIPEEYVHSLVTTVHFDVVTQMSRRSPDGQGVIHGMLCRHLMDRGQIVFFNRVSA